MNQDPMAASHTAASAAAASAPGGSSSGERTAQLHSAMQKLTTSLTDADALEASGQYRDAAELVASSLAVAHANYVRQDSSGSSSVNGVTLVRQPQSSTMHRRSYVERYKSGLRVDWKQWERMSMRPVIPEEEDWHEGDEEEEAAGGGAAGAGSSPVTLPTSATSIPVKKRFSLVPTPADKRTSTRGEPPPATGITSARRSIVSAPVHRGSDAPDWQPETLEKQEDAGRVELVHTCCDGTKVKTAVEKFELATKVQHFFNRDPKKTMKGLYSGDAAIVGEGGRAYTHEEIARWLITANKLSKNRIGDYLGRSDDDAVKTLAAFLQPLDFSAFTFDEALRFFLSLFRLPGEAQQIDRIMQVCNLPKSPTSSHDLPEARHHLSSCLLFYYLRPTLSCPPSARYAELRRKVL